MVDRSATTVYAYRSFATGRYISCSIVLFIALSCFNATLFAANQNTTPGRQLYAQFCSSCHGANLQGGKAKSLADEVWDPEVIIVNRGGAIRKSLPQVVEVESDGTVTYHQ